VKGTWRVLAVASVAYLVAVGALIGVLGFTDLWYGFHDLTDTGLYHRYAMALDAGRRAYFDLFVEYPPLAVPFLRLPPATRDPLLYTLWFNAAMLAACGLAAVLTAAAAKRIWPEGRRAYAVAAAFAASVLATGAIVANRLDAVVTLVFASVLWLMSERRWTFAAVALAIGFGVKLTPAVLLPVPFLLADTKRERLCYGLAFLACAALPFLPFLGAEGLPKFFQYHLDRPLQIESALASPLLAGHLAGLVPASVGHGFGSQFLDAPGAAWLAQVSGPLALVTLGAVYVLIWRRIEVIRADPSLVPLAAYAVVLAAMASSKVLSPQYFVWILPFIALVLPRFRALAALSFLALLLTQIEFPSLYWSLVALQPLPLILVIARNALLVACLALAVWHLWKTPAPPTGRQGRSSIGTRATASSSSTVAKRRSPTPSQ
jgi:hypothetical protein